MKSTALPLTLSLSLTAALSFGLVLSAMPDTAAAADERVKVKRRARPGNDTPAPEAPPERRFSKKSKYNKPAGQLHSTFTNGTPMWLIKQAFDCALNFDESAGFDCYTKWVVEARKDNPRALKHLRMYQWAHFRKWAPTYLEPGKKFGLREASRRPETVTGETDMVKVFMVSRHRDNPAPIELKREAGVWRIFSNSL